jgi:hypothetical protein
VEKINRLLKILNIQDDEDLIGQGLDFFRSEYQKIPNKYPGDSEYYDLFERGLSKGLTLIESLNYSKSIINREMILINAARAFGIKRNGCFWEGGFL